MEILHKGRAMYDKSVDSLFANVTVGDKDQGAGEKIAGYIFTTLRPLGRWVVALVTVCSQRPQERSEEQELFLVFWKTGF